MREGRGEEEAGEASGDGRRSVQARRASYRTTAAAMGMLRGGRRQERGEGCAAAIGARTGGGEDGCGRGERLVRSEATGDGAPSSDRLGVGGPLGIEAGVVIWRRMENRDLFRGPAEVTFFMRPLNFRVVSYLKASNGVALNQNAFQPHFGIWIKTTLAHTTNFRLGGR